MATVSTRQLNPEEAELERKKTELAGLETELADRELELATLKGELTAFERTYLEVVGRRYAELDQLEVKIAEARTRRHPTDETARVQADAAKCRARESARAVADIKDADLRVDFKPSDIRASSLCAYVWYYWQQRWAATQCSLFPGASGWYVIIVNL